MSLFVITGASGGGKSALIQALAIRGYRTVPEVGRQIVREQLKAGGAALPWLDKKAFRDELFDRSIAAYKEALTWNQRPVFFDRSFVEAIAFSRRIGLPSPRRFVTAAEEFRFADPVIVCPPWREIYKEDRERRGGLSEAREDYSANAMAYESLSYRLEILAKYPLNERVEKLLEMTLSS